MERRTESVRDNEHGAIEPTAQGEAARGEAAPPEDGVESAPKGPATDRDRGVGASEDHRPAPQVLRVAKGRRLVRGGQAAPATSPFAVSKAYPQGYAWVGAPPT